MKNEKPTVKNIGIDVTPPKEKCEDKHCPFHGQATLRGRQFVGTVIGGDTHRTAKVEWLRPYYIPKYERYEQRKSRITVHNPACINAQKGDKVRIIECKPISKTKNFIIIEKLE